MQNESIGQAVLLVDDEKNVLLSLSRALRNQPYVLYTARSGEEAIHLLKSRQIDLVVSDDQMPGMSGTDLLTWIASNLPDVVRIMLTGNLSTAAMLAAINQGGVWNFFAKPCDEVALGVAIRKGLEHRALVEQNRKLIEVTQRQVEDITRSNRELEQFAKVIAHDLKSPMATLESYTELLQSIDVKSDERMAAECLDFIQRSTRRMRRLIDDVLSFSVLHQKMPMNEDVDFHEALIESCENLAVALRDCDADLDIGLLPVIRGHQGRLVQLLQNLIANAIKFRASQSPQVRISGRIVDGGVEVHVADNGIGIPVDDQQRVFEAFSRAHEDVQYPGLGLGLATCSKIVAQHGGKIRLESEVGVGTTVILFFPESAVVAMPSEYFQMAATVAD